MSAIQHTLRVAARKLTLVRAVHVFLATVAVSAAVWTVLVLVVGVSRGRFAVLGGCTLAALVVGLASARRTVLDAARRVERSAGWQERLSTMVELEAADAANPFHSRLRRELDGLLTENSPVSFIPWNVQRVSVFAAAAVFAAVVVTTLVPRGVVVMFAASEASARRERAEVILRDAVGRLTTAALDAPGVNELRLELVGLLDDVRRGRRTEDLQRTTATVLGKIAPDPTERLRTDAGKIAGELRKSAVLAPTADTLEPLDTRGLSTAVRKLSENAPGMTRCLERRTAADALTAAADAGRTPGLTEPLKKALLALAASDFEAFGRAMRELADATERAVKRSDTAAAGLADVRDVLTRVAAVLAGRDDPGRTSARRRADFFVEDGHASEDTGGSGNLTVRGAAPDISEVWKQSHAADASLPKLADVIRSGEAVLERTDLDPEHREYVRRYFAVEPDND